ncbi:sigma-70 family RNA polymerase sigma factor [bacterium]|nr:sigma-70 family RNA polymerase sigma factor [bacterium]
MSEKVLKVWAEIKEGVFNSAKVYLLKNYCEDILAAYRLKINYVVSQYLRHLPSHVAQLEKDDLKEIAQLEFIESLKLWNVEKYESPWPFAHEKIKGAMKDYIRYITKSNPTSFYDWVTEASYLYLVIRKDEGFEDKVEKGVQLSNAMKVLSERDRNIVIAHIKDDLSFKEIAKIYKLSESQISRIMKAAVEKLKKALQTVSQL